MLTLGLPDDDLILRRGILNFVFTDLDGFYFLRAVTRHHSSKHRVVGQILRLQNNEAFKNRKTMPRQIKG